MQKAVSIFAVLISLLMFYSCNNEDEVVTTPNTSLEIIVKDESGNNVNNASVKLFTSETDLNNETNQIGTTLLSDSDGKVSFNNLSPVPYYWIAKKDCNNNLNHVFSTNSSITENTNNTRETTISISNLGTLKLVNSSNKTFNVQVMNSAVNDFSMNGNTTRYIYGLSVGAHMVFVNPSDGSSPFQQFVPIITCGEIQTVTFSNF
jgi:hypothetical protein